MNSGARSRTSVVIAMVTLIAVLAMLTPASAAQNTVVAGPGNASMSIYYTQTVVIQKGKTLDFLNLDIALHDVRSNSALFSSLLVGFGKRTPVNNVKSLPKGVYKFHCSIHPNMKGQLRVI